MQRVVDNRGAQKRPADVLSIILNVYIADLPCAAVASSATYQKTPTLPICTGAEEGTARKNAAHVQNQPSHWRRALLL